MTDSKIIDVEAEPEGKRERSCATCSASHFPGTAVMGECRATQPTHTIFLIPKQDVMGRGVVASFQGQSGWPPVKREQWCRDSWQPKEPH